jgi:hypothetical protein
MAEPKMSPILLVREENQAELVECDSPDKAFETSIIFGKQITKKLGTDMHLNLDDDDKYIGEELQPLQNVTEPDSLQDGGKNKNKQDGLTGIAGTEMLSQTYVNENDSL